MGFQKLLYLLGAFALLMAWSLWGYCAYRNVTARPAKFYLLRWACTIDQTRQPLAFAVYVAFALVVFLVAGAFCGLLIYYKPWPEFTDWLLVSRTSVT